MSSSGLIIRGNERHEISLPVRVRVGGPYAEAVKFRRGMTQDGGWIEAHLIDFSAAGAGLMGTAFFPKGTRLEFEIPNPDESADEPLFRGEVKVMRVQMTDRRPAYLIGTSFGEADEDTIARVDEILALLGGEGSSDA